MNSTNYNQLYFEIMDWDRILLLPRELQVQILKYLTPAELSVLESFESFHDLVFEKEVVRKTDICDWKHKTLKDVQTYLTNRKRRNRIRELCLNNLRPTKTFFDKISLEKNFKNLHSLHIVNCNIGMDDLHDLLMCLPLLEELSWSIAMFRSPDNKNQHSFERIKRVYVESFVHGNVTHHLALMYVLTWFGNMECLHVHFSTVHNTVIPSISVTHLDPNFKNLHTIVCTSDTFNMLEATPVPEYFSITMVVQEFLLGRGLNSYWKNLWIMNSHLGMDLNYVPQEETQVIGMKGVTIKGERPQPIIDVGGPKVKFFQLDSCQFETDVNQERILKAFFRVSPNITELNLFNTHFNPLFSPCVPISTLRSLKKLLIPICCIFTSDSETSWPKPASNTATKRVSRVKPHIHDVPGPLSLIVEGCPELTDLDIRQFSNDTLCSVCRGTARWKNPEASLFPIHRMRNLQTLTLVGLQANCVQRGRFLEAFRDKNTELPNKLSTLRLYFIGLQGHQTYWESLSSALPTFSHLQTISLQHSTLSLESMDFWKVFSKVKELERLCLVSNFSGQLPVQLLQEFILQVPKLYVLHIHSRARNFRLTTTTLHRFSEGLAGVNRNPMEIVIQHFPRHIDLSSFERVHHKGKVIHMEKLCVPGTDIAQVHRKCGLKHVL